MGQVFWGLHSPIAAGLVKAQNLQAAFETGSYLGFGALQLAAMVENVWTVEFDAELYEFCRNTYGYIQRINFVQGESDAAISTYIESMTQPTLFVLDAHWVNISPISERRPRNLCPVIEELHAIASSPPAILSRSAVIVDDAEIFLGSLKASYARNAYPSITEVLDKVRNMFERTIVTDDVIVGCNGAGAQAISEYLKWRDRLQFP